MTDRTDLDPAALAPLTQALDGLRQGRIDATSFCAQARQDACDALARLPARYGEVWHNLLDRLESGALFAEESCSFSQRDLIDSLQLWLDKAALQLKRPG